MKNVNGKQWSMEDGSEISGVFSDWFVAELFVFITRYGVSTKIAHCDCENYCCSWYISKVESRYDDIVVTLNAYLGGDEVVIVFS